MSLVAVMDSLQLALRPTQLFGFRFFLDFLVWSLPTFIGLRFPRLLTTGLRLAYQNKASIELDFREAQVSSV